MSTRKYLSSFALLLFLGACATGDDAKSYDTAFEDEQKAGKAQELEDYQVASLSPGKRPPLSSDEAGLWMKMDNAEKNLKTSGNIIHDKRLNRYLNKVVCRVARRYCNDVRVYAVRMPYFNASMAPNGTMQIWSGLMLRDALPPTRAAIAGSALKLIAMPAVVVIWAAVFGVTGETAGIIIIFNRGRRCWCPLCRFIAE